jgi:hypothetical protein
MAEFFTIKSEIEAPNSNILSSNPKDPKTPNRLTVTVTVTVTV